MNGMLRDMPSEEKVRAGHGEEVCGLAVSCTFGLVQVAVVVGGLLSFKGKPLRGTNKLFVRASSFRDRLVVRHGQENSAFLVPLGEMGSRSSSKKNGRAQS